MPARWRLGDIGAITVAVLVVGSPALFTKNGFAYDFTNHLWLVWVQEHAISAHLFPTYFTNTAANGVFYPVFMFYGGTLYAATGALAAILGGAVVVAYVGVILLSIAAAYGGLLWLARQLGARSWTAHAPAITYVTSAYYVTNLYGRGAWPEFVAVSALPLVFAGGWRLVSAAAVEPWPAVLFVVAVIFFSGAHNITLMLGALFLVLVLAGLLIGIGRELTVPRRRIGVMLGLFVLAISVNAWFLLPDLVHASDTQAVGQLYTWAQTKEFNTPWILFDPLRTVPTQSSTPSLFVQAPDWAVLWAFAATAALWTSSPRRFRRAACWLWIVLAAIVALILIAPLWDGLPGLIKNMQFPYRLNTYVSLAAAGLVLIWVVVMQGAPTGRRVRLLALGLAGAIEVSCALCVWQLWVPNTRQPLAYANRNRIFVSVHQPPRAWDDVNNYADASQPVVPTNASPLLIDPAEVNSDHVTLTVDPPAGDRPFPVNLDPGPYAVRVGGGLERVGRTTAGSSVLRRVRPGSGPVQLTLAPASGSVTLGRWLSILSIVALLSLLATGAVRRALRRW
jgi:hypothetical protein